ncbi:MAG TPA: thioredoxin domain-containing protein [Thermoanaerobaculia bacterium]|nr:thioredoxin domain-containing protein [Thermoanaerobaculia bacterium]
MKRALLLLVCLLTPSLFAADGVDPKLTTFVEQAMTICPDSKVALEKVTDPSPGGFTTYRVTHTSSIPTCGRQTYAMVSKSGHVVVGDITPLAPDSRPVNERVRDLATRMLRKNVDVKVGPAGPDGLRPTTFGANGPEGNFTLSGFLEPTDRYLIVGARGKLGQDPGTSLIKAVTENGSMTRGKKGSKITIVEISDFQCAACRQMHETLEPLIEKNLDRIEYRRVDLPLYNFHDWTLKAAVGSRAIQKIAPEKYWDYVNYLFANQTQIKVATLDSILQSFAEINDIDWATFSALYNSPVERQAVLRDVGVIFDHGIFSTPTYIVNGRKIFYGENGSHLEKHLKEILAR